MIRNRKNYFLLIIITILIGLISRTDFISNFITDYFGDYLYAILFFLIFGFLFIKTKSYKLLIISLIFCYGIEFLQLYQADWINFIRNYKISRLILGNHFQWNDIISYTFGAMTAYILEILFYSFSTD
ncbi:Protein of unknown function (DUF2809) [Bernardetia litoralis DSM 6794]|uniref:DUF2809 domain-containing protein n=1 Tax=Bernardetia litoralis (strain ATCC 23117 / DSM 6794 / NBRC 15988 / NCIMB 1366 / Fx l1 / Sio-4) TaxID=880071 RepID=I4AN67_BERLS|nr:DUF2809 domain-containing protein [Bernardetia litoralis]AFM05402.1 Protein of unknown function (DUF2809) [Bernardetia litoralis DSM 6794]